MLDGVDATLYVLELIKEIYKDYSLPIQVYTDNKSLQDALKSNKYVNDKRLRIDIGALKEVTTSKYIENIIWICVPIQLLLSGFQQCFRK